MEYGGLELPEVYTRQDQLQVTNLIKQLQWDGTLANDILVTLDNLQMESRLVTPVLETTEGKLNYVRMGWLSELRRRFGQIDKKIWIEKAWTPKLQREGDAAIM